MEQAGLMRSPIVVQECPKISGTYSKKEIDNFCEPNEVDDADLALPPDIWQQKSWIYIKGVSL